MTMNILVAYHTKGGATEEYAKVIAETLTSKDQSVETVNLKENVPYSRQYNYEWIHPYSILPKILICEKAYLDDL